MKRACIYLRVAGKGKDAEEFKLMRQKECEDFIAKHSNWKYEFCYADIGCGIRKRPMYKQLLQDANDGKIDIIVTRHPSYMELSIYTLVWKTKRMRKCGVEIYFLRDGYNDANVWQRLEEIAAEIKRKRNHTEE